MATKAQKRAKAQAEHDAFMENLRLSGLKAQQYDRDLRAYKLRKTWEDRHEDDHKYTFNDDCPLCDDMKAGRKTTMRRPKPHIPEFSHKR